MRDPGSEARASTRGAVRGHPVLRVYNDDWQRWRRYDAVRELEELVVDAFETPTIELSEADSVASSTRYAVRIHPYGDMETNGEGSRLWIEVRGANRRAAARLALDWARWIVAGQDAEGLRDG